VVSTGYTKLNNALRPPRKVASGTLLAKWKIKYQSVDLLTEDGIRLSAWYTPPANGAVILLAHPYGEHRPEWVYELLARKGYGVLAWDARAHGTSGGEITTLGYTEMRDVKAALKYALAQPGVEHIGGWGGSMGGATMIHAAAMLPQIEAIFVDSSFASLDDEFDYLVPSHPLISPFAKVVMRLETGVNTDDVDLVKDIATISPRPVFIAQGEADTTVPPDSGERLFNAAGKPRFLWTEPKIPHMGLFLANSRRYQRRLVDFFNQQLLKK
jgi:fermentation-respiration switch protein FrsA (DUF1100 family)